MLTGTATKLEEMTDRAAFERLALHILRYAEPSCETAFRLGTNAKGETIPSPFDGFKIVDGGSLLVAIESTTQDASTLEKKWLYDHKSYVPGKRPRKKLPSEADDGDLIKSIREASKLRKNHPGASIEVFLVTNQVVSPDLESKVAVLAAQNKVKCEIWEQSRLADFLDIDPTGHFLRSKYFGEGAERISLPLLLDIGKRSLLEYASYARASADPSRWVDRELDAQIDELLTNPSTSLIFATGESGFGKTVACHRVLARRFSLGQPALWISAETAEQSQSLHAAIDSTLRQHVPTLIEYSVRSLSSVLDSGNPMVVIVDDVSRAKQPAALIRRIGLWTATSPGIVVLCPVWPRLLNSAAFTGRTDVQQILVGELSLSEARAALPANCTEALAESLGNDPFLIGLVTQIVDSGAHLADASDPQAIMDQFVELQLTGMQTGDCGRPVTCGKAEHRDALECCAKNSLKLTQLAPPTRPLKGWLGGGRDWIAMRELIDCSGIVRSDPDDLRLQYRHDRLRRPILITFPTMIEE